MISPCEILQLDIPDVGRNHIQYFFLVPVRKIISVQEIYSGSLFGVNNLNISPPPNLTDKICKELHFPIISVFIKNTIIFTQQRILPSLLSCVQSKILTRFVIPLYYQNRTPVTYANPAMEYGPRGTERGWLGDHKVVVILMLQNHFV